MPRIGSLRHRAEEIESGLHQPGRARPEGRVLVSVGQYRPVLATTADLQPTLEWDREVVKFTVLAYVAIRDALQEAGERFLGVPAQFRQFCELATITALLGVLVVIW